MTCGIYQIKNKITGDIYIGSSSNVEKRLNEHRRKLLLNLHHSIILQRSYNKYGLVNFEFSLICKCDLILKLYIEQLYLESMRPYFNTSLSSSAPMQGRKHSDKTKLLFKQREIRKGKDSPSYGKKWTEKTRIKSIKSRTGLKRSQDFKNKISAINKKNNQGKHLKPYIESIKRKIIDCRGNLFDSLSECAIFYNFKVATICDVLKRRSNFLDGKYRIWYYDEYVLLSEDSKYIVSKVPGYVAKRKNRYGIRIGLKYYGWYDCPIEASINYNIIAKEMFKYCAILLDMEVVRNFYKTNT